MDMQDPLQFIHRVQLGRELCRIEYHQFERMAAQ